jgi:hypothetical protein
MSLCVLDGELSGQTILVCKGKNFEWPFRLTVRSLGKHVGACLGSDGGWLRRPHRLMRSLAAALLIGGAAVAASATIGVRCALAQAATALDGEQQAALMARDCLAQKERDGAFCDARASCFSDYRARFPQGPARAEFDALAGRAALSCVMATETQAYERASSCAQTAQACGVDACFAQYIHDFPSGSHALQVRATLDRARERCAAAPLAPAASTWGAAQGAGTLADGDYLGEAGDAVSCGVARQRLNISVCHNKLTWSHKAPLAANLPPVPLQWEGVLDSAGELTAHVRGNSSFVAAGHLTETSHGIDMRYPGCGAAIPLTVARQLTAGCDENTP